MKADEVFECGDDGKGGFVVKYIKSKHSWDETAFILPERFTKIESGAVRFAHTSAFILPDGLEEIGANAFYGCKQLKLVFIPKSVKIIETCAFYRCDNLEIYCEGEPAEGWIDQEPTYKTEEVTTDADYAYDFHRGGVSRSSMQVKVYHCWNPDPRPVHTNCPREEFMKIFKTLFKVI